MAVEENVKVAVRLRPFNKRELDRNSKLCVQMNGNITTVNDFSSKKPRSFTYDYSYWSFDGSKEDSKGYFAPDSSHPNGSKYCDQIRVYNDLGKGILKNAWAGYNATLFAYGQTGSGKSWSVIGYGTNKGLVPLICEELFQGIKSNKEAKQFEVKFSMLEIYNEIARDLLEKSTNKSSLKIRQHPKKGFYADGLKSPLVTSHQDIAAKMEEGTVNRTIRSTNMNATSSRAHTIVTITFIQKFKNPGGQETAKSAIINLVDLAGSERVESTGATGDRLKEGAAINLSLTCLGNCINALVKLSNGESARIPFRDSTLTKLLKNALGGNSKTIMIAAISPADINYEETVSTLNFADRAKQIKTKAVVNEDPTEKLIRELKEENDRLKKQMKSGKIDADFMDADSDGIDDRDSEKLKKKWEEEMKARMLENDKELMNMKKTYEEKLKQATKESAAADPSIKIKAEEKQTKPHIYNLNLDPQLNGKVIHILKPGATSIGNRRGQESDITMIGPGMQPSHAAITVDKNNNVTLKPVTPDCRILVNGSQQMGSAILKHNDRIVFGSTQIWVFQNPLDKVAAKSKSPPISYEYAQEEIAAKSGIDINSLNATDAAHIQEDLLEVMPAVEQANSISEELDKKVKYEIVLLSPEMRGETTGKTEVNVRLKNLAQGTEFIWPKNKFLNRFFEMKEMYNKFEEETEWELPTDLDPFHESLDTDVHIGTVQVILQPIAHLVELREQLEITSMKGAEVGLMNVEIIPCNKAGKEYSEKDDVFLDTPEDLIGREIHFKLKIPSCRGLPSRYTDIYCSYQFYLEKKENQTSKVPDTVNPDFKYSKKYDFKPVTKQLVEYLSNGSVTIKVLGKQKVSKSAIPKTNGVSTKELLKNDRGVFSKTATLMNGFQMNGRVVDPQKQSIIVELLLMKKTQQRLQQRVDNVTKLVKECENSSRLRISTTLLREVMNANSPEQADAIIRKKLSGESDRVNDGTSSSMRSSVCTLL